MTHPPRRPEPRLPDPGRAQTVRGRDLPPPRGIPRLTHAEPDPDAGDVNPRLTDGLPFTWTGRHAVGRPQHAGRGLPLRVAYGVAGSAVVCVAAYLLMGHWFGQTGKAAVVWLLHTAALLGLLSGGLVLFSTALPAAERRDGDG